MWRSKDYWSTIREMGRPSIATLLNAIDDEMHGDKHYSEQEESNDYKGLKEQLDMVDQLSQEMAMLGVDYSNMSVQEAEQAYQKASEEYMAAENAGIDEAEEERKAIMEIDGGMAAQQPTDAWDDIPFQTEQENTKEKYLKDGNDHIYDNAVAIHQDLGLIEKAPERFEGTTVEDVKQRLNVDENGAAHIQTPIENVTINDEHYKHLLDDNEEQRKTFLNYTIATLERPNIIIQKKDNPKSKPKNHYFKFFLDTSGVKPHLQIVKVASDGSFYVTNYRPTKSQVRDTIKEGQVVYDLSNVRDGNVSPSVNNNITPSNVDVKQNQPQYQSAYVSMKNELEGDYLDADRFEGTGEGNAVHGWGNYALKDRETNKAHYYDWMSEDRVYYDGVLVDSDTEDAVRFFRSMTTGELFFTFDFMHFWVIGNLLFLHYFIKKIAKYTGKSENNACQMNYFCVNG